ncbi:MAG: tRNA threonylcarbamoyladenosine dehydratase [Treponema sp.]|jgi:tRNA A37 threonylcarbamoyladenosine dehydratase|nr:tRNA threonylcarbamoyladenosine dehydratase [Treponema sp.]
MNPMFQRLCLLVGQEVLNALSHTRVLVFGAGGVGSWAAEALVRCGIGRIGIVDSDAVCITNINRQAQALFENVGKPKVVALKERLLSINPSCMVDAFEAVFSKESVPLFRMESADYIIDAIDSLSFKLDLIETSFQFRIPLFSSMGMAQKLDPTQLQVADIWDTYGCPLARLVRQGLRKRGFDERFMTVFSPERLPRRVEMSAVPCGNARCFCSVKNEMDWCASKKIINGSAVTVTASAGLILASLVMNAIVHHEKLYLRK